jgi:Fe-S-cluster containining protein
VGTEENRTGELPAGGFSAWLQRMRSALRGEGESEVPCDGCTACCTSSQFVLIEPDETRTLASSPSELLFPAPRLPSGHVVLGYDERGHCPMLVDNRCAIYEDRPRTCRIYDCRVFPATGLELEEETKTLIGERAGRWRFDFPGEIDDVEHRAVQAAAQFVQDHREVWDEGSAPRSTTQRAVAAVEISDAFVDRHGETGRVTVRRPDVDAVSVVLAQRPATGPGR